ncbi:MAG: radical SAM protein [Chloroflexota bacterium]
MPDQHALSPLERAVLETVAYTDIFSFPVTTYEAHRYLIGVEAALPDVQHALEALAGRGQLTKHHEYYCLPQREHGFALRTERAERANQLWAVAEDYGQQIAQIPFVQMVAVTGSLAVDNMDRHGDIDYLIVTSPERLWVVRMMIVALVKLAARNDVTLCPNYLITTNALVIHDRNLFTARELTQMIPLAGMETYRQMRDLNDWTQMYLPNAASAPPRTPAHDATTGVATRLATLPLQTPVGTWLDHWEMNRKIRKFQHSTAPAHEADFSADWCKGHFDGHMTRVQNAYNERLTALHLAPHYLTDSRKSVPPMSEHKVLFGQSYYLRFDQKLWDAMQPYPPLGTMYAASLVRENDYDVAFFDAMLAESETEWEEALRKEQPTYAVIYEDNFNYLSKMCLSRMRDAAFEMTKMAKRQGCKVIVAGSDATDHYDDYLNAGADYVIVGEGDETLVELLGSLTGRVDIPVPQIMGVVSAVGQQAIRRPVMRKLDELPFPAWDLIDVQRYKDIWYSRHGYFSMNLVTTRGCPYHCNWCAKPIWGQRYNVHSPERIAQMMQHLKDCYQPDHIWFADDIMGLKPGWIERLADVLEETDSKIPFKCLSRVDLLLRGETIAALKRAGCEIVWVGAESGSQKILDAMEKGTAVEEIREAAVKLHEAGVQVGFFLQFGYPGETRADIEKTLQLVWDTLPDNIGISVSYPLPGTSFHQRVKDQLGTQHNWEDSSDMAMLYEGPFSTAFYRQLHTVVHKSYRARKTARRWLDIARSKQQFERKLLRDTAAMVYHTVTLPFYHMKLNQLATQTNNGLMLVPSKNFTAAATPSPQPEDRT